MIAEAIAAALAPDWAPGLAIATLTTAWSYLMCVDWLHPHHHNPEK
ncbi:hypothetical protein AB0G67_40385 [Streptomyces sp. NPDC021056]